jgi:magnesium chelatase accessory protein
VHGLGASTHSWRKLAPLLAKNFRVVALDLPGHGFTDLPKAHQMSLRGMTSALEALIRELGLAPAHCLGHSAGAAILARMCLDKMITPVNLISLNGALLPLGGAGHVFSPLAKLLFKAPFVPVPRLFAWIGQDRRAVVRLLRATGSTIDPEGIDLYAQLLGNSRHLEGTLAMMANWDLRQLQRDLPRLKTPLILVVGSRDRTVPADEAFRVRDLVPGSKLVCIRHVGHLAHEERSQQVADLVIKLTHAAIGS